MNVNAYVSIIIPCYNDGQYIQETLASVQAQTYLYCEIIIVDDKSDDRQTILLLEGLKIEGYTVLRTPEGRKGAGAARNVGIEHAKGVYILPLDADDIIAPEYVSKAVQYLQENPHIDVCGCRWKMFGLKHGLAPHEIFLPELMVYKNILPNSCIFYKKDWMKIKGYDEKIAIEDYSFWISLLAINKKIHILPDILLSYRVRKGSRVTVLAHNEKRQEAFQQLYEKHKDFFTARGQDIYLALQCFVVESEQLTNLFSFKLCNWIFKLEIRLRNLAKKIIGRT